jgi:hypothetical protein
MKPIKWFLVIAFAGCTPQPSTYDLIAEKCGPLGGVAYERCADRVAAIDTAQRQQRIQASEALIGLGMGIAQGPPRYNVNVYCSGWNC